MTTTYGTNASNTGESIEVQTGSSRTIPEEEENESNYGSSVLEASLNLISATVGAGIIGFGRAIADSGGLLSLFSILAVGYMSKLALDLVVTLAVETEGASGSFEDLATVAYGKRGREVVMISKGLFALGCMVGLIKITQDNLAPSVYHLLYGDVEEGTTQSSKTVLERLLLNEDLTTVLMCSIVMLPLSFLRDVTPLAKFAGFKVFTFSLIVLICIYLAILNFDEEDYVGENFTRHWLEVKEGYIQSLGTFVFAFVSQHTVHLVFLSLRPGIRTIKHWQSVSTAAVSVSTLIYILLGMSVYVTFWDGTSSSMLETYAPSRAVTFSRILLSISSLLSYPLHFVSCREMIVLSLPASLSENHREEVEKEELIAVSSDATTSSNNSSPSRWLIPGSDNQLIPSCHAVLTIGLYTISLCLAIKARSLTDVLNLVGCATGTVIAFVLPALFSFRLRGYSFFPAFLLVCGSTLGVLGTLLVVRDMLAGGA